LVNLGLFAPFAKSLRTLRLMDFKIPIFVPSKN
jgi:hypothetical protein